MTIEVIAISYGDARYGRSCNNCNHCDIGVMEITCGLHCLPTKLTKVCGSWCNEKHIPPIENQIDLF